MRDDILLQSAVGKRSLAVIATSLPVWLAIPFDAATDIERFRATGPGWQARINEALRKAG